MSAGHDVNYEWIVWSTGKHAKPIDRLDVDVDYVMSDDERPRSSGCRPTSWYRATKKKREALATDWDIQLQEFSNTAPMRSFKFLARTAARNAVRRIAIFPPMTRFFDLQTEPTVELSSLQLGSWMWIQPEVFERTGIIFQGGEHVTDELHPIDVRLLDLQGTVHLLIALDAFLEGH